MRKARNPHRVERRVSDATASSADVFTEGFLSVERARKVRRPARRPPRGLSQPTPAPYGKFLKCQSGEMGQTLWLCTLKGIRGRDQPRFWHFINVEPWSYPRSDCARSGRASAMPLGPPGASTTAHSLDRAGRTPELPPPVSPPPPPEPGLLHRRAGGLCFSERVTELCKLADPAISDVGRFVNESTGSLQGTAQVHEHSGPETFARKLRYSQSDRVSPQSAPCDGKQCSGNACEVEGRLQAGQ